MQISATEKLSLLCVVDIVALLFVNLMILKKKKKKKKKERAVIFSSLKCFVCRLSFNLIRLLFISS